MKENIKKSSKTILLHVSFLVDFISSLIFTFRHHPAVSFDEIIPYLENKVRVVEILNLGVTAFLSNF